MIKANKATAAVASRRTAQTARAVVLVPAVELVTVEHGQPVTTTERVAAAAGLKHASVIRLVRERLADLEELGKVRFQIRLNPQGSPTEYAELNEQHAALLFLYQRNTAKVERLNLRLLARDVPYADRKAQCRALWLRETGFILEGGAQ